jgi:hypothetical protein
MVSNIVVWDDEHKTWKDKHNHQEVTRLACHYYNIWYKGCKEWGCTTRDKIAVWVSIKLPDIVEIQLVQDSDTGRQVELQAVTTKMRDKGWVDGKTVTVGCTLRAEYKTYSANYGRDLVWELVSTDRTGFDQFEEPVWNAEIREREIEELNDPPSEDESLQPEEQSEEGVRYWDQIKKAYPAPAPPSGS